MKIKTIAKELNINTLEAFDTEVNAALDEGWLLTKREVIPGAALGTTAYAPPVLYAELVQLDEPEDLPAPPPMDPFDALRAVQEFCDTQEKCGACPLYDWCCQLRTGGDPTDWKIPEKEEPEA